jgi:hypothetical protein
MLISSCTVLLDAFTHCSQAYECWDVKSRFADAFLHRSQLDIRTNRWCKREAHNM